MVPELLENFFTEAKNTPTWMHESIKTAVIYKEPFWKGCWRRYGFDSQIYYHPEESVEEKHVVL